MYPKNSRDCYIISRYFVFCYCHNHIITIVISIVSIFRILIKELIHLTNFSIHYNFYLSLYWLKSPVAPTYRSLYICLVMSTTKCVLVIYFLFQGYMRSEMHGMELAVQSDDVCSTLEQFNPKDMLCVKGLPPRFDSVCNVSNQIKHRANYEK